MLPGANKEMQRQLLSDPQVQEAVKNAGQDALNDPRVQNTIVRVAQEKFPEYADIVRQKALEWARDPAVQVQAYHYAGTAAQYAGEYASQAGDITLGLVEQGPTGLRVLGFAAGVLSCVNAVMFLIEPENLVNLVAFVVCGYQMMFAITTIIFEAPPHFIEKIPAVTNYQDMLIDQAKFISQVLGRGLFYIFQGSLWLSFASLTRPLDILTGIALCFVGVLLIAMHVGHLGTVSSKLREGYERARGGGDLRGGAGGPPGPPVPVAADQHF